MHENQKSRCHLWHLLFPYHEVLSIFPLNWFCIFSSSVSFTTTLVQDTITSFLASSCSHSVWSPAYILVPILSITPSVLKNQIVLAFSTLVKTFQSLSNAPGVNARPCNIACRKKPAFFAKLFTHFSFPYCLHLSQSALYSFLHPNVSSPLRALYSVFLFSWNIYLFHQSFRQLMLTPS